MSASGGCQDGPRVVRVGGLSVRVHVEGDGEPLLLLNGFTRPLESWVPLAEELPGRTLVSFDAPGVGGSPAPILPLSIGMLARIAEGVLDATGLDRADVLGFSHGGAVAQQLAFQTPSRVGHLVLAATTCGVGSVPGSSDSLRSLRASSDSGRWPRPDVLGAFWHALAIATWSSIPFLGAIAAPTLVVCGSRDRVVPPANSRLLARRIPGAALVLLQAGHDLQRVGQADQLAAAVESFLSDQGALLPLAAGG
jgi:pimeloyl-ACP methyl ester carboxylesterase